MSNSEAFERLLQKSLQTQDFPPIPPAILKTWQAPQSDPAAKWVWILPILVFVLGLGIGAELAPLGFGNAFSSVRLALRNAWHDLPEGALTWAFALLAGVLAIAVDSIRTVFGRLKQAKTA